MDQSLFGAFDIHTPESCPINNLENKMIFLEIKDKLEKNKSKCGVKKQNLSTSFNTVKIVALKKYKDIQNKIKKQRD